MADRDPSLQAECDGALADQAELPGAERAAVVQVDVDHRAVGAGQPEHDVQVPHGVAVDPGRVDPADHLDAVGECLLEQLGGAGLAQDAVLRERHLLDVDPSAHPLDRLADRGHTGEAELGRDVGVAAHLRGTGGQHRLQQHGDAIHVRYAEAGRAAGVRRRSAPPARHRPGAAPTARRTASCPGGSARRPARAAPAGRPGRSWRCIVSVSPPAARAGPIAAIMPSLTSRSAGSSYPWIRPPNRSRSGTENLRKSSFVEDKSWPQQFIAWRQRHPDKENR